MFDFLDLKGHRPGYLELSQAVIEAIESGRLAAYSPLPPSRVLADALGISRDTVLNCYRHLKTLGWTESHGTGGTFVGVAIPTPPATAEPKPLDAARLSNYAVNLLPDSTSNFSSSDPVIYGAVPKQYLPIRRWKLSHQRSSETLSLRHLQYQAAVLGRPELRSALASYLNRSKGILCSGDEVAVFNISFAAMTMICRLFMNPGDTIAMEDPGFGGVRDIAHYLSLDLLPVPLDAEGISVEAIERAGKKVKMVYVTPDHQEPTGTTMTIARRKQLLSWAQKNGALIIEDDYDGIFHYGTRMPPTLKSMDTQDNVVYLASFWQVLYPLTTLCIAVLPQSCMSVLHSAKRHTASLAENLPQLALADVLNDGYLQKHCRKLEKEFAVSRRTLMYELKRAFGERVNVPHQSGGLTMMVRFNGYSDKRLIEAAQKANLPLGSTEMFYADPGRRPVGEVYFYFAGMSEAVMRKSVTRFAARLSG